MENKWDNFCACPTWPFEERHRQQSRKKESKQSLLPELTRHCLKFLEAEKTRVWEAEHQRKDKTERFSCAGSLQVIRWIWINTSVRKRLLTLRSESARRWGWTKSCDPSRNRKSSWFYWAEWEDFKANWDRTGSSECLSLVMRSDKLERNEISVRTGKTDWKASNEIKWHCTT